MKKPSGRKTASELKTNSQTSYLNELLRCNDDAQLSRSQSSWPSHKKVLWKCMCVGRKASWCFSTVEKPREICNACLVCFHYKFPPPPPCSCVGMILKLSLLRAFPCYKILFLLSNHSFNFLLPFEQTIGMKSFFRFSPEPKPNKCSSHRTGSVQYRVSQSEEPKLIAF